MNKRTIWEKLSSRKFWVAVASWVTSLLTAFNVADTTISKVILIISGIGALIAYMFAESIADKANATYTVEEISVDELDISDEQSAKY